jgi:hypothetical protein
LQGLPSGRGGRGFPENIQIGPPFRDIANTSGVTATAQGKVFFAVSRARGTIKSRKINVLGRTEFGPREINLQSLRASAALAN